MIKWHIHWLLMRSKLFVVLTLFCTVLFAQEVPKEDAEILAQNVTKEGNLIHAVGNVVLYSPKYLITADEAYYEHETGDLELFGNITMLEGTDYSSRSGYTKLNLKTDEGKSSPLFFFDETTQIWLKCDNAILNAHEYITQKSIVSSCNAQDPDWKITFTSGELNKESKWMHLYNPVFYAGEMPILYLPYFAFSTDKTRRTGLLKPELGIGDEGFFYLQPIYFAPDVDWDMEVSPQIRTLRGEGIHNTVRFVDSAYSHLEMTFGYFKEHNEYAKQENLTHNSHYGYKIMYDRSALLSTKYTNLEDGLWFDINYLNDIDYYNTMSNESKTYDRLVVSRLNYYAKQDLDYFGVYAKYYINTMPDVDQEEILQELPILHYHRFANPILTDNILYSVDYKARNFERQEGVNAVQHEFSTPLTIYFSLLEDYLHVNLSEHVYATHVSYDNGANSGSYGHRINNFHKISTFTELAKGYEDFFHTLYIGLDYRVPSYEDINGAWDYTYRARNANGTWSENDLIPTKTIKESAALSLKEFFYDKNAEKKITHAMKQFYYMDDAYKYGDLENDLKYHVTPNLYLGHNLYYSHEFSKVSRNQISINYSEKLYATTLRYTNQDEVFKDNSLYIEDTETSGKNYDYITFSASTTYIPLYNVFASVDYDINEEDFKSWSLGFKKSTKCWDYSLMYRDTTVPKATTSGDDYVNRKGVMLQFNFYPIGNIHHDFATEKEQRY